MTLTPEQLEALSIYAAGVATPLVLTGIASWFVMWRNEWKRGTPLVGEEFERNRKRGEL